MADENNDTGGSSAGDEDGYCRDNVDAIKMKTYEHQSGIYEEILRSIVNQAAEEICAEYGKSIIDSEAMKFCTRSLGVKKDSEEKEPDVFYLKSEPSSDEDFGSEIIVVDPSKTTKNVKEKLMQMLEAESSESDSNSQNFGILTNIEGLLDDLCEIVPPKSKTGKLKSGYGDVSADDSEDMLAGIAELFKEADDD